MAILPEKALILINKTMGYIKEPKGIDFIVAPSVLTVKDRLEISAFIANYKKVN